MAKAQEIKAWAEAQPYDEGWHWVIETHALADYERLLADNANSPRRVRKYLRQYVKLMLERERDCAWA